MSRNSCFVIIKLFGPFVLPGYPILRLYILFKVFSSLQPTKNLTLPFTHFTSVTKIRFQNSNGNVIDEATIRRSMTGIRTQKKVEVFFPINCHNS